MRIETNWGGRPGQDDAVPARAGSNAFREARERAAAATTPATRPTTASDPRRVPAVSPEAVSHHVAELLSHAVAPSELAMFRAIERANESVESGGRGAIASRLVTTAGPGSPASFGRSQLLVSLQVDALERMSRTDSGRTRVEAFGVARADLLSIDARGDAASRWYDSVVRARGDGDQPMSRAEAQHVRGLVRAGDVETVVLRYGARFEADTGIARSELADMALTARLLDPSIQREFMAMHRSGLDDGAALRAMVARHPELDRIRARIADDPSLAFFLRRPRRNGEHRAAWYTRAARVDAPAFGRLIHALESGADRVTSRERQIRNYHAARAVLSRVSGFDSLPEARRTLLLGQLARVRHGHPKLFVERFGSGAAPRVHHVGDVERVLRSMATASVETPDGDQGRSVRAFTDRLNAVSSGPLASAAVRVTP